MLLWYLPDCGEYIQLKNKDLKRGRLDFDLQFQFPKVFDIDSNSSPVIYNFSFNTYIIYRYQIVYLGLLTVGVGSWMFHMTLKYEMQLLDELPMVWGG